MARLARPLQYVGIVVAVLGLGKFHALRHEYDYTGSSRFAWSFAYVALLSVSSYAVGLPEFVRTRAAGVDRGYRGLRGAARLGVSIAQLVRTAFSCRGSSCSARRLILIPWFALCATLARHAAQPRRRSRAARLRRWARRGPAAPRRARGAARATRRSSRRCSPATRLVRRATACRWSPRPKPLQASLVVIDRDAQADEHIVAQAALLHERGARVRTLSLFYEQWLGKLPLGELERVSLMFDIGEVHRDGYGRLKRVIDVAIALLAMPVLLLSIPFVGVATCSATEVRSSTPAPCGQGRQGVHDLEVPHHARRTWSGRPSGRRTATLASPE